MRRILLAAAFALASFGALAASPMETSQLVDGSALPIGTDANPFVTRSATGAAGAPSTAYSTGQVAVGTSAAQVIAAGALPSMRSVKSVLANTGLCYLGPAGVTASTGFPISPGETYTQDVKVTSAALYAVCANAAQTLATIGY